MSKSKSREYVGEEQEIANVVSEDDFLVDFHGSSFIHGYFYDDDFGRSLDSNHIEGNDDEEFYPCFQHDSSAHERGQRNQHGLTKIFGGPS